MKEEAAREVRGRVDADPRVVAAKKLIDDGKAQMANKKYDDAIKYGETYQCFPLHDESSCDEWTDADKIATELKSAAESHEAALVRDAATRDRARPASDAPTGARAARSRHRRGWRERVALRCGQVAPTAR